MQLKNIIFGYLLLIFHQGIAQFTSFSTDSSEFFDQSKDWLASANKSDAKKFMDEFEVQWYGGKFTDVQRMQVYKTANRIRSQKLKPYPDYKAYLTSISNFVKKEHPEGAFDEWHQSIDKLAAGNKKRFSDYLKMCSNLFAENIIFKSSSTVWQASESNFKFKFQNNSPLVIFEKINLQCLSKGDSGVIYETSGIFDPLKNIWRGEGGRVTWSRAALDPKVTYAELNSYKIGLKSSGYNADSVLFYTSYFEEPILGVLGEKVLSNRGPDKVVYPRFESYDKRLIIKNIFDDIDYDGGFTMEGGKLIGKGTFEDLAKVTIKYEGKPFIISSALIYTINATNISSANSEIKILLDKDSIYHPGLQFKYVHEGVEKRKLTLIRGGQGTGISPYFNSYHKIDMVFEALSWRVGDDNINFGRLPGSTDSRAFFESQNYFSKNRYDKLTGMGTNPLPRIKSYVKKIGSRNFLAIDFASYMGKTMTDIKPLLYNLNNLGLITYNSAKGTVAVNGRMYRWLGARSGRMDYDVIQFISEPERGVKYNASLSLLNYDLSMEGVNSIVLSNAQGTKVFPDQGKLILKENRSFTFKGVILAGRTEIYGDEFSFDYDKFRLNLIETNWLRFFVKRKEKHTDGDLVRKLQSQLIGARGYIDIDDAKNKSGKNEKKHQYPIMKCVKKTFVFYDNKNIHDGAYTREKFYFEVEPFDMDSLDNFETSGMRFDGKLVSASIFPDLKESLVVQDDYSLGFIKQAPEEGISLYLGKANYENEISLSNKGLMGSGDIDYLSSHAESSAITFLPNSLSAIAEVYVNKGGPGPPELPNVTGENVKVVYVPDEKVLFASSINKTDLLEFYDSLAVLNGTLALRPEGMNGNGLLTIMKKGELLAVNFKFKERQVDADTSDFDLLSFDLDALAFRTTNVNAHVDFDTKKSEFKSNGGESFVEFPDNQYICYMDKFNWYMKNDDLEMEAAKKKGNEVKIDTDMDLAGPNFFSIHPKQDSLSFRAPKARFDVRKKVITCTELEYITVADSRIYPDSNRIFIERKAKMTTLNNSSIVSNYITKYHTILRATTDIKAKNEYKSSGYYQFKDELGKTNEIFFDDIEPDTALRSYAKGQIEEKMDFKLSPHFNYYGQVEMFASQKELLFSGVTKIRHNCNGIARNWMNFTAPIDPKDIYIPVTADLKDEDGKPVAAGIIMNTDSISLYPTFLSNKRDQKHKNVITAKGFLKFNKKKQVYQIGNKDKLQEENLPGNLVTLSVDSCTVRGQGQFDFGINSGQLSIAPYGKVKYSPQKKEVAGIATIVLNFPFSENALDKMSKDIKSKLGFESLDYSSATFELALREICGLKKSDNIISDLTIHGEIKKKNFAEELNKSLILPDIRFVWNKSTNSYRSVGRIGIGNILKKQVYKYVDGYIELTKRSTGDMVDIYLKLDGKNFYYFNYKSGKKGIFQVYSSNAEFNKEIKDTKTDNTKFKGEKGVEDFQFMLSSPTKAKAFLRRMED
ncbi:MAG: hypothetical protein HOL28_06385 [Crocinitomicaceae bacterium]|nr:hypothetical protein [Crocinitomicaceae bacterium]